MRFCPRGIGTRECPALASAARVASCFGWSCPPARSRRVFSCGAATAVSRARCRDLRVSFNNDLREGCSPAEGISAAARMRVSRPVILQRSAVPTLCAAGCCGGCVCPVLGASADTAAGGECSVGRGAVAGLGLARFVARTWSALGWWVAWAAHPRLRPPAGSFPVGHFGPVLRLLCVFWLRVGARAENGRTSFRRAEILRLNLSCSDLVHRSARHVRKSGLLISQQ